jgi:hypothetical protein
VRDMFTKECSSRNRNNDILCGWLTKGYFFKKLKQVKEKVDYNE